MCESRRPLTDEEIPDDLEWLAEGKRTLHPDTLRQAIARIRALEAEVEGLREVAILVTEHAYAFADDNCEVVAKAQAAIAAKKGGRK